MAIAHYRMSKIIENHINDSITKGAKNINRRNNQESKDE